MFYLRSSATVRAQGDRRIRLGWPLFASLFALIVLAAGMTPKLAEASSAPDARMQKYLGTWNYDLPDLETGLNIDVLSCPNAGNACDSPLPLPLKIPQIGNVVFSPASDGTVLGVTDQSCHWRFAVTARSLELIGQQRCFNHSIGSEGTLTRWSVTVDGNHEQESIVAISHQPTGDLIARMGYGARTRVTGVGGFHSFSRFLGGWTYDPPNWQTLVNVVSTDQGTAYPASGTVRFSSEDYGTLVAQTPDGCRWTLAVQGNTAELNPATQACHLATGTVSLRYWAVATDGERADFFMAGSDNLNGRQKNFYLFIGAVTRTAP